MRTGCALPIPGTSPPEWGGDPQPFPRLEKRFLLRLLHPWSGPHAPEVERRGLWGCVPPRCLREHPATHRASPEMLVGNDSKGAHQCH